MWTSSLRPSTRASTRTPTSSPAWATSGTVSTAPFRLSGTDVENLLSQGRICHFKDVNDSFGHATGDEVIAAVGRATANRLRRADLVLRYGGEEFVAFLPDTPLDEAAELAEEIRCLVATTALPTGHAPSHVHVSVGVACLRPGDDAQSLLAAADAALYQAKRTGRNRVCLAPT